MFSTIQYFYNVGMYTKDDVETCVPMFITQDEADIITNQKANIFKSPVNTGGVNQNTNQ